MHAGMNVCQNESMHIDYEHTCVLITAHSGFSTVVLWQHFNLRFRLLRLFLCVYLFQHSGI